MKPIVLLLIIMSSFNSMAQDNAVKTEMVNYSLSYDSSLTINDTTLEFSEISPDSRCPKGAMCVRAGEAIATIKIYEKGVFKKETKLTFYPHGVSEELTLYLQTKKISIWHLELTPYPEVNLSEVKTNYTLNFKQSIVN